MVGRRWNVLLGVLLIALLVGSVGAVAEITLVKSDSAQAEWWFVGQHPEIGAGSAPLTGDNDPPFCQHPYGDHHSVELATHASGAWAYLSLDSGNRMLLADIDELGFRYLQLDVRGPSLALALIHNGVTMLAVSPHEPGAGVGPHTIDSTAATNWRFGTWDGEDPTTFVADIASPAADFATLQGTLGGATVSAVIIIVTDVLTAGSATAMCAVDHITLEWDDGTSDFGGVYNLEPRWPFAIGTEDPIYGLDIPGPYHFDDWTQAPLPLPSDPPRQFDQWCIDPVYCPHCVPVDDQNLWGIVHESDLPSTIPAAVRPFASPFHALYFGQKTTGTYDLGERAIGAICSPLNHLNPADRYVSIEFDTFWQVEDYAGDYDQMYVQIWFDEWDYSATGWYDPFATGNGNPGDVYNSSLPNCSESWKTVWYRDSSHPKPQSWQHVEITHYLNANNVPHTASDYQILIPPEATYMRIRFVFNSEDGAANNFFGWIIDNVEKHHGYDAPGCTMETTSLPQGRVGDKYGTTTVGADVYEELLPYADGVRVRWELVSVMKGDQRLPSLPSRLALDPRGRIYGIPDPNTTGTYRVVLRLICANGRPVEREFSLVIRPPYGASVPSQIGPMVDFSSGLHYFNRAVPLPSAANPSELPGETAVANGENLWHQSNFIRYILEEPGVILDYGTVAFFGKEDVSAPNYATLVQGGRAKGCMQNAANLYVVGPQHVGQELVIGFKSWRNVESYLGGDYDITSVHVQINNGAWVEVWIKTTKDPAEPFWKWEEVETGIILTRAGDKINVRFCFDSIDGHKNGPVDGTAYGWAVDEVTLYAGSTELRIPSCPKESTSVNEYYRQEVRATGGPNAHLEWSIVTGSLPPGLTIDPHETGRVNFIEGYPREAGTFRFTIQAKVRGSFELATRECVIEVGRNVTLFWEDFEGDPYWSGTGLWRFTTDDDVVLAVQGINVGIKTGDLGLNNHAGCYGRINVANYDTGATTSGMMTLDLEPIDLVGGPEGQVEAFLVTFDQWRHVEAFGAAYDKTYVQVQLDGGPWHTIWTADSNTPLAVVPMKEWTTEQVGVFRTNGASTMLIRFVFDSVDKWYNKYTGWLIDNIRIESASADGAHNLSNYQIMAIADPRDVPAELQVMNVPNPVTDVNTTTFMVRSAGVDAMKIEIYDLSGALVFSEEVAGNELVWHTDNDFGEFLANGIYLYHAYVRIQGEWIKTSVQKLVILR